MHWGNILPFVGFIVIVVFSIAQRLAEMARVRRREQEMARTRRDEPRRSPVPIENIPEARPRPAGPRTTSPGKPLSIEDVVRQLVDTASGEGTNDEETGGDEGWRPVQPRGRQARTQYQKQAAPRPAPPPQRAAPVQQQRRVQVQPSRAPIPPSKPAPVRPASQHGRPIAVPRATRTSEEPLPIELEQRENERRWREEMERRKQLQQQLQSTQRQLETIHARARLMPARRRLLHSPAEVRRALILSEILGPPRAMRDIEDRW